METPFLVERILRLLVEWLRVGLAGIVLIVGVLCLFVLVIYTTGGFGVWVAQTATMFRKIFRGFALIATTPSTPALSGHDEHIQDYFRRETETCCGVSTVVREEPGCRAIEEKKPTSWIEEWQSGGEAD